MTSATDRPGSAAKNAAGNAGSAAKDVTDNRWVQLGARVGLACYGVTHLLIAWLALQVAFGGGGEQANQKGAFQELADNTFGVILLWIIVLGFVAVALWRLGQAIWGYRYVSDKKKQLRKRGTSAFKAAVFATLAVWAATTAAGSGGGGGGGGQKATAGVLGLPGGQWIVGLVGLGIIIAGGNKIYSGWKKKFEDDMDMPSDQKTRQAAERTGQIGYIAKGVSIAVIGVLVVIAAIQFDPSKASGLDAALRSLAQTPLGPWLLVVVALGLAAYGVFCWFDAKYHRV
jgi:uncharacterized membrane protein YidH (DUF202 family)